MRRSLRLLVGAAIVLSLSGCGQPSAVQAPDSKPETSQQAISRLFGPTAVSTVDTRTIPGRAPVASIEVKAESTPTAGDVFGVLAAMSRDYGDQGRYMILSVVLPRVENQRARFVLRYNPTAATVPTDGATVALAPGDLLFGKYVGSGSIYMAPPSDVNIVLASKVTTEALVRAATDEGEIASSLKSQVGLP